MNMLDFPTISTSEVVVVWLYFDSANLNYLFRFGAAHARNGGTMVPYPRPQNIWIACDTEDPRHGFENLYMKVCHFF